MDLLTLTLLALAVVAALGLLAYWRLQRAAREVTDSATGLQSVIGDALPQLLGAVERLQAPLPGDAPTVRQRFYYMRPGGAPLGPTDLTTLRAMVLDGRLDTTALAASAGTDEWRPLETLFAAEPISLRQAVQRKGPFP